jgi:hypothetical protein
MNFAKGIAAGSTWIEMLNIDKGKWDNMDTLHSILLDMDIFPPIEVARRDRVCAYFYLLRAYLHHLSLIRMKIGKKEQSALSDLEYTYLGNVQRVLGLLDEGLAVTSIVERVLPIKTDVIKVDTGKKKIVFFRAYKCFLAFARLYGNLLQKKPKPARIATFIDGWFKFYDETFSARYSTVIGEAAWREWVSCTNYLDELDDARMQPEYHKNRTRRFWRILPISNDIIAFTNNDNVNGPECPKCHSSTTIYCTKKSGVRYWKCPQCDTKGKLARTRSSA